jgi:hypothetical protein
MRRCVNNRRRAAIAARQKQGVFALLLAVKQSRSCAGSLKLAAQKKNHY